MASSSSAWQWKHSVFLSFSGEDVRDNFVSFLYEALSKISSDVYIDYRLKPAEEIAPALMKAIEGSRIAVIVFSKSYASSTWCLDELEKIIQWNESHGQMVVPVFYNVDSSHVHDPTTGIYAEAIARHEWKSKGNIVQRSRTTISRALRLAFAFLLGAPEGHEEELDQLQRWKNAMVKAANFKGWDSKVTR